MSTNPSHDFHFSNDNTNQRSPGSQRHTSHPVRQSATSPQGFESYSSMGSMLISPPGTNPATSPLPPGYSGSAGAGSGASRGYGPGPSARSGMAPYQGYDNMTWNSSSHQNQQHGTTSGPLRPSLLSSTLQGHIPNLSATERPRAQAAPGASGRAPLPSNWLQDPPRYTGLPGQPNGIVLNEPGMDMMQRQSLGREGSSHDDDDLIPTAIVIKNIPFAVKKEQLVALMTDMGLPIPYAFNYHFDNGVFRGLAFANFTSAEETQLVINQMNHYELAGRKLRVEYKKMLPLAERERIEREKRIKRGQLEEQHRPLGGPSQLQNQASLSSLASGLVRDTPSPVTQRPDSRVMVPNLDLELARQTAIQSQLNIDFNDPMNLCLYTELLFFKRDMIRDSMILPPSLTPPQRRVAHSISHQMGLFHVSKGTGDDRAVHIYRSTDQSISPSLPDSASNLVNDHRRALARAATTDFSDVREMQHTIAPRSSGLLGFPDSPGGIMNANLRGAKSFHDLRSWSPSPSHGPINPRFPEGLLNGTTASNPNLTSTLGFLSSNPSRDGDLVNGLSALGLGNGAFGAPPTSGSPLGNPSRSPWDNPSDLRERQPAPIGSNRAFSSQVAGAGTSGL